ncbi:MAG: glycosyltransferase family 2 protein [Terriglobales bacterium]
MLTISIINYREVYATAQCVLDLMATCDGLPYRILLRDHSQPLQIEAIRTQLPVAAPVQYFASPENPGFGAGHNRNFAAVSHAPGDVFAVMNNDVRVSDGEALRAMLEACTANRIVSCTILNSAGEVWYSGGTINPVTGDLTTRRDRFVSASRSTQFVTGCCLMADAALYRALGGFDERFFMYGEDLDFCLRARAVKAELVVVNRAIIHQVGSGQSGLYSDNYLYENTKNRLLCVRRHRLGWPILRVAYFFLKYGLARAVQLCLRSQRPLQQIRQAWRGLLHGYLRSASPASTIAVTAAAGSPR